MVEAVRHLVFWQEIPSPHQAPFLRALASHPGINVTLVTRRELPADRREMGWSFPDFGSTNVVLRPTQTDVDRIASTGGKDWVHILSGTRLKSPLDGVFERVLRTPSKLGLYAETGDWQGLKGVLRLWRSRHEAFRLRNGLAFVLAIGNLGMRWYRGSGYPDHLLFPFGYFVDRPIFASAGLSTRAFSAVDESGTVRLVYVGRCNRQKGVDVLFAALARLLYLPWRLTIVGDGPELERLRVLSDKLGLTGRIEFLGFQPHASAMNVIANSDLLVLPSRGKDGWGAVVNEAIMLGVPVVCTDCCGASDLLDGGIRGSVCTGGSIDSLTDALRSRIRAGVPPPAVRAAIRKWSGRIEGAAAASYFLSIVACAVDSAPRPNAPWLVS